MSNVCLYDEEIASSRQFYQYEAIDEITNLFDGIESKHGIETVHFFAPKFYARLMKIPKDSLFTAIRHGHRNYFSITKGEIFMTNGYDEPKRYSAPFVTTTHPGTQRAGRALTDAEIFTCHRINLDKSKDILGQLAMKEGAT